MGVGSSVQKYLLSMHVTYRFIYPDLYIIKYTAGLDTYLWVWVSIRYGYIYTLISLYLCGPTPHGLCS